MKMDRLKKKYEVDEEKVLQEAIDVFGIEKQIIVTIEELSELQKALTKYLRYDKSGEYVRDILEGIVDVEIMIKQVKKIFKTDELYTAIHRVKIRGLKQLVEKEKENGNAD